MLKAYRAFADDIDTHELVFAENASKARSTAHGLNGLEDAEFIDIRVARAPEFDRFSNGYSRIINLEDPEVQKVCRELGWWYVDEERCECCDLGVFEHLPESQLIETDEGLQCQDCRA